MGPTTLYKWDLHKFRSSLGWTRTRPTYLLFIIRNLRVYDNEWIRERHEIHGKLVAQSYDLVRLIPGSYGQSMVGRIVDFTVVFCLWPRPHQFLTTSSLLSRKPRMIKISNYKFHRHDFRLSPNVVFIAYYVVHAVLCFLRRSFFCLWSDSVCYYQIFLPFCIVFNFIYFFLLRIRT